nr:MAG TPA: hypothetical protein [Caudoviricetes sp.]
MEQLNQITLPLGEHGERWKRALDLIQDLSDNDNIYIKRGEDTITLYLEPREAHKQGYSRYKWVSAQEDDAIEERRLKRHAGK